MTRSHNDEPAADEALDELHKTEDERVLDLLAKVDVAGGDSPDTLTALRTIRRHYEVWEQAKAEKPPYDPGTLLKLTEASSLLRQCFDAMVMGVWGHGYQIVPVIDTTDEDIDAQIERAIILEREAEAADEADALRDSGEADEAESAAADVDYTVTETEIKERRDQLERQIASQTFKAQQWFKEASVDQSFLELCQWMGWDREAIGHGAWEFARDSRGRLRVVGYVPGHTVYPLADASHYVDVEGQQRVSPIKSRPYTYRRKFSRYVQVIGTRKLYFKELGDPRIVSGQTGKVYADVLTPKGKVKITAEELFQKKEPEAPRANEMIYFPIHSPRSTAGIPRYVGNLPNILGQRAAEETTWLYFDNKSVPVGAWVILGGTLHDNVKKQIRDVTRDQLKGVKGFHRAMIIEVAAPPTRGGSGSAEKPEVKWIDLMGANRSEAGWIKYGKDNRDKVGASFRLPPLLRGEAPQDLTRANSYASMEMADTQVFSAERMAFDWTMTRRVLADLGCDLVEFKLNSPVTTDPEVQAKATDVFAKHGGMLPNDVRKIAARTLNLELDSVDADWATVPLSMALAGFAAPADGEPQDPDETTVKLAWIEDILGDLLEQRGLQVVAVESVESQPEQVDGVTLPHDAPINGDERDED